MGAVRLNSASFWLLRLEAVEQSRGGGEKCCLGAWRLLARSTAVGRDRNERATPAIIPESAAARRAFQPVR